ncbi:unnamed protein product, partial [Ectocarpus fasciculatus]
PASNIPGQAPLSHMPVNTSWLALICRKQFLIQIEAMGWHLHDTPIPRKLYICNHASLAKYDPARLVLSRLYLSSEKSADHQQASSVAGCKCLVCNKLNRC